MNTQETFSAISNAIKTAVTAAHHITLLAHQKPDPDALGACAALSLFLKSQGKKTEIIYPGRGTDSLPYAIEGLQENQHSFIPDLIISCDTPVKERLYFPDAFEGITHINIDHHLFNTMPATIKLVDTNTTSTCELIERLFTSWSSSVSPAMAEALLFGIMCDTLNFKVPGTNAATLRTAANLIDAGANLSALNRGLIVHHNPQVLALWGALLADVHHTADNAIIWTVCSKELLTSYGLTEQALNGFVALLAQTVSNDISILFYEHDGKSKASLRSKKSNVNAIARHFGGGGHLLASGITSSLPLERLVKEVMEYTL